MKRAPIDQSITITKMDAALSKLNSTLLDSLQILLFSFFFFYECAVTSNPKGVNKSTRDGFTFESIFSLNTSREGECTVIQS